MTSVVSICNAALGRIRGATISALTDATTEAEACNTYYDQSRSFVLSDMPWNFAGKSMILALLAEVPEEWSYAYAYPSDCLTIRYLHPESKLRHDSDPIPYEIGLSTTGSKIIMSNLDLARCRYTVDLTDVNQFTAHFVTALSWYLASEIGIPVAGTSKGRILAREALEGYRNSVQAAISANASEAEPGPPREPETIRAHQ